jgi:oligopeptide/dipeptide ABC transporter, ATP-binding protein, C-terminal domain
MSVPAGQLSDAGHRSQAQTADDVLIEIRNLRTHFYTDRGIVRAVDGVDLVIRRNRTIGIVGESGCGKSIMALSIMGLVPRPPAKITGEILFHRKDGTVVDLVKLDPKGKEIRAIRGAEIAMIFQEPMTSLNPVYTIGNQIMEAIRLHQKVDKKEARERAIEMLRLVGIPAPEKRVDEYPHQLSGGMRQRAMIAMALSCNPSLLIADEPTTALDVTIQAQILELMERLQEEFEMAIMMITHDLGVVAGMADEVAVMYLGQIVEHSDVRSVFKSRYHPYTEGLMGSIPVLGSRVERLTPIQGMVPDPRWMPEGCRFADRCPKRMPVCDQPPPVLEPDPGHFARCWLYDPEVNTDA